MHGFNMRSFGLLRDVCHIARGACRLLAFLALSFGGLWLVSAAAAEEARSADTLLPNGGFDEVGNDGAPTAWDRPDGLGVRVVRCEEGGHGNVIQMDTRVSEKAMVEQWKKVGITQWDIPKPADNAVAETYGLSFYSNPIPVEPGCAYTISFDFKGPRKGAGAKVWVRGYGVNEASQERRKLYETIVNCRVDDDKWRAFTQEFSPTKRTPAVTEIRVMLFAYFPPGVYLFDNVKINSHGGAKP